MRITFTTEEAARAVEAIWERHGFEAVRDGATIETSCPTLWAIPVIDRAIGFDQVEEIVLPDSPPPRVPPAPRQGSLLDAA